MRHSRSQRQWDASLTNQSRISQTLLHIFHLCDAALAPQCPIRECRATQLRPTSQLTTRPRGDTASSAHSPAPFFSLDLSSYDDDAVWAASEPGPPIQVLWAGAGARRVCLRYRELVPAPRLAPALGPSSSRSTTHSQRQQQQPLVTPHQPPPPATAATPPIPNFGETRSLIVDFGVSRPDDAALMFVASICACIRSRPPGLVALLVRVGLARSRRRSSLLRAINLWTAR